MCPSRDDRVKIDKELDLFTGSEGMFGHEMAKDTRNIKHPALWWKSYGDSAPHLRRVAVRVLSATCSATGCERNWSVFEQVHTKRRNRLSQQRMNALVYVKYNLQLAERLTKRKAEGDSYDPICLSDLESDDEWIAEEEDSNSQRDPTWMDVHECFQLTEAQALKKKRKRGPRNLSTMKLAQGKGDINRQKETRLVEEHETDEVEEEDEVEAVEPDEDQIQAESENEWLVNGYDLGD
ncbi:hypothetical protein MKW94_003774 [Papaver nudicaule]|uniref:HAT C-terminal dimerisation domain-containing protein n=1 Tax=Papaver nudicaule TaxID=74823 RepID=A0AA41RWE5_PAPNU|nr:hypothetical protein [Papaver nudicaule]